MKPRALLALLAMTVAVAGLSGPGTAAKDEKKKQGDGPTLVKYHGAKKGTHWGKPVMILIVKPLKGRGTAELVVPKQDPMSAKFDPDPRVVKLVKSLKRGEVIQVKFGPSQGRNVLTFIGAQARAPGSPKPPVFVGTKEQKLRDQKYLAVVIKRDNKSETLLIPNHEGKDGKQVPDKALAEEVAKLKKGDRVEVRAEMTFGDTFLKSICRYYPPEKGEFVKVEEKSVEGAKHLCMVIKKGRQARTVLVPNAKDEQGKPAPDAELAAAVKDLKPGQIVEFKFRKEGKNLYLRQVEVVEEKKPRKDKPK